MVEDPEELEDEKHEHICMECGEGVLCDDDECEDEFQETLCSECLEEEVDNIEEENAF